MDGLVERKIRQLRIPKKGRRDPEDTESYQDTIGLNSSFFGNLD